MKERYSRKEESDSGDDEDSAWLIDAALKCADQAADYSLPTIVEKVWKESLKGAFEIAGQTRQRMDEPLLRGFEEAAQTREGAETTGDADDADLHEYLVDRCEQLRQACATWARASAMGPITPSRPRICWTRWTRFR